MSGPMHADEVEITDTLVRRLVDGQFPRWRSHHLRRLPPTGTDNQLFRLGEELVVRLPRIPGAADAPRREARWLPKLARDLPLAVPLPVGLGEPTEEYPFPWTVVSWLDGDVVTGQHLGGRDNVDWVQLAYDVAGFLRTLRSIDATGAPLKEGGNRGGVLAECDAWVRQWTSRAGGLVDGERVLAAWEESLAAPTWQGAPVWLHSDIHEGNLLTREGRVTAVIDWGGLGAGDPAVELNAAWGFLPEKAVPPYREAMELDEVAWLRGRGWALVPAISGLVYYQHSAPQMAALAARTVARIIASLGG